MADKVLTVAAQITVDGTVEGRAQAHTLLDLLFDAAAVGPPEAVGAATPADSKAGGAVIACGTAQLQHTDTTAGRIKPTPEELSVVLTALATGADCAPLNTGERQMLQGIAKCAPAPLPFDNILALLGSGAKFGNVSSCIKRRFSSRGYELPYVESNVGYYMEQPLAAVVLDVLGGTGG